MINLTLTKLSKYYSSKEVFKELTFFSNGGKKIGIAGSNGAGKSTLLRCICGLTSPSSGTVAWSVNNDSYLPGEIKPFLGYAAPYVELYEELTARENLQFILDLRSHQPCEKISDLIYRFELPSFSDSLYGELSSGQQQRVKLAAAVIHRPLILCLDEPGTNLDDAGHIIVQKMADQCVTHGGIVFIASNQAIELNMCESIIDLDKHIQV